MHYADGRGLTEVCDRMAELAAMDGDPHGYWTPSTLLVKLAGEGRGFDSWRVQA
jgi:hypothetical protein